ncbi:MAG: DUF4381 family protein [Pseudomonadales bacterium]|nr:DUF4381 family protein [Pseudomonadales bacterium]
MQSDPLQQLRDVHAPIDPSWWPPAPGWWILGFVLIGLLVWLCWQTWAAWRRGAPLRAARNIHQSYCSQLETGDIDIPTYLHSSNELLKRVLVRGYRQYRFAPLSGDRWLIELDRLSKSDAFTSGPGKALGDNRFSPEPSQNIDGLPEAINRILANSEVAT